MTTSPTSYCIAHITDLMDVPAEHLDECLRDIAAAVASLHICRAAMAAEGITKPMREVCTHIDFIPDGKGQVTPTINGMPAFTMTFSGGDRLAEATRLLREARIRIAQGDPPTVAEAAHGSVVHRIDAFLAAYFTDIKDTK